MKKLLLPALFVSALALPAMPPDISVEDAGRMKLGGLNGFVQFYDRDWKNFTQNAKSITADPGYPVSSEKQYELKGVLNISGQDSGLTFQQWVREETPDTVSYSMNMRNETGLASRVLCFTVELPAAKFSGKSIVVNGKAFELPATASKAIPPFYKVKTLNVVNGDRKLTITGEFTLMVQDNRTYQVNTYSLRLLFPESGGKITRSKLALKFGVTPLESTPLPLQGEAAAAFLKNRGIGKNTNFAGLKFDLGSVIHLAKGAAKTLAATGKATNLYLIHNADTADAKPEIEALYADGSRQTLRLENGRDFAVTQPLLRLPNGAVATSNNSTLAGLYLSHFTLEDKELKELKLSNAAGAPWHVTAATLANTEIPVSSINSITYIVENSEWRPLDWNAPAAKGSVLDFSNLLDAPAGKHGWVTADAAGHFSAGGKRIRFYGPNLCFSAQFLEKKDAEALADEFARLGYTSIRFHHFDNELSDPKGKDSRIFLPEKLDQLDYLFFCLKERGIYITIDLYCSRRLREGELPEIPDSAGRTLKAIAPISKAGRDNWKAYSRNLLRHKNPYTGLTWGEDPALYSVSLLNENDIHALWKQPNVMPLYIAGYADYLRKNNLDTTENRDSRGPLFLKYLTGLHVDMIRDFRSFLQKEIGYKGLITDINFRENIILSEIRQELDFVDVHTYWDHPHFLPASKWSPPYIHHQRSALQANAIVPRMLFASRIFGKPFTVTEINYTFPNRYRAESGPLLGAYAALQDWDGLYRFSWAHERAGTLRQRPVERFDIVRDPISLIAERVTALLFVRGDVSAADKAAAWTFGDSSFNKLTDADASHYPQNFQELGFFRRIGSLRDGKEFPGVERLPNNKLTPEEAKLVAAKVKTSENGEISYDPQRRTLQVITPKTESLTLDKGELTAKVLTVKEVNSFQSVTACAMDGKPLAESSRILLFHQSDVTNEKIRFSSETMNAVENWGSMKLLVRRATAKVELAIPEGAKVQALGSDGLPKAEIAATRENGKTVFTADTAAHNGTLIYLVSR